MRANVADMANSMIFGTCTTAANTANKIVVIDKPTDSTNSVIINGYPFNSLTNGLMFAVYFENGNSAAAPYITFQLNDGTQSTYAGDIYCNALTPATNNELFSWKAGSLVIFTLIMSQTLGNRCIMANWQDISSLKTLSFSLDSSVPSAELDYNPTDATDSTFSLGSFVTHDDIESIVDPAPAMFSGYTIDSFVLTNNYDSKLPVANGTRKGLLYSNTTNTSGFSISPIVNGYAYYKTETPTPGKLTVTSKDNQTPAGHAQTLLSNYQGGVDLTLELTPHKVNAVDLYGDTMYGTLTITHPTDKAILRVISTADVANDIWLGSNNTEYWAISSRDSSDPYLGFYSKNTSNGNAWVMKLNPDKTSDFYGTLYLNNAANIHLRPTSNNATGGIAWYYYNSDPASMQEKARIWVDNSYTASKGPNYRVYQSDGTLLKSTTLAFSDGSNANGNWNNTANEIKALNSNDNASNNDTWRKVWISYQNGTTGRPALSDKITFQTSSGTLQAKRFLAEHISGGSWEYRVKYSDTVDFALQIGTGNVNHGIYDSKGGDKWMIYEDGNSIVKVSQSKSLVGAVPIARASSQTTVANLVNELRYSNGCMGSFNLGTAYTGTNYTIPVGWYNYLWIPHREGGANGAANSDNCNSGTLLLFPLTPTSSLTYWWWIRYTGSAIAHCRRCTSS